jgi:hypothetical protein
MSRIALALAVLLGASRARAEAVKERPHAAVALEYLRSPAAARCPGPDVLREEVKQRLLYDLFAAEAPERLAVKIERRNGRYRVTGELRDHDGRVVYVPGTIDDPSCVEVVTSLAILLAVHFTRDRDRIPPSPPVPPAASGPARVPVAPLRTECLGPRLDLGLGPFLALNRAPKPAMGVAVSATARWSSFSIALDLRALAPVSSDIPPSASGTTARVDTSMITSAIAPCLHHRAFFLCSPLELGMRQFSGSDTIRIDTKNPLSAGLGLRGGAEWVFAGRFGIRGSADLLTMWTQNILIVESRRFWESPLLAGVLSIAVTASLGADE